jgi:signal transduction histidine kinase
MLMVIQAEAGVETLDGDPDAARASLLRIQEAGRQGLDDLRGLVRVLRTSADQVDPPGLEELEALVTVVRETGLDVALDRRGRLGGLDPGVQEAGFRLVQESLTNVLKHSAADRATVLVDLEEERLVIEVSDPGPSAARSRGGSGQGLQGMAERLAVLGGQVRAGAAGEGFVVRAEVPVAPTRSETSLEASR